MQYAVSLSESQMPQDKVDEYLQHQLIEYIGGLSQFYGKRVLFDFTYTKEIKHNQYIGTRNIRMLKAHISEIKVTNYLEIKPIPQIEPRKTRWERFKQFVKGE